MFWPLLHQFSHRASELRSAEALAQLIADTVGSALDFERVTVFGLDDTTDSLVVAGRYEVHMGKANGKPPRISLGALSEETVARLAQSVVPVLDLGAPDTEEQLPGLYLLCRDLDLRACLILTHLERLVGLLGFHPGERVLSSSDWEFMSVITRLSASFLANHQLASMATQDFTTGLTSGRYFARRVEQEVRRCNRYGQIFSLVVMDVDDFKGINDTYGHQVGDRVLREVAAVLKTCCRREVDVVARYGGEEFIYLLPHTPVDGAVVMAERVLKAVEGHPIGLSGRPAITLSAGVASFPQDGSEYAELFSVADERLYAAKRSGKNQVVGPQARVVD